MGFLCIALLFLSWASSDTLIFKKISEHSLNEAGSAFKSIAAGSHLDAYFLSLDGFTVYRYDFQKDRITHSTPGKGSGPGEFSSYAHTLTVTSTSVLVGCSDRTIHEFDLALNFRKRHVLRTAFTSIIPYHENAWAVSGATFVNAEKYNSPHEILIYNADFTANVPGVDITPVNTIDNFYHTSILFNATRSLRIISQIGKKSVAFHDQTGQLLTEIPLSGFDFSEARYMRDTPAGPPLFERVMGKSTLSDYRIPLGSYLSKIRSTASYTLVQGGVLARHPMGSIAQIFHENWTVHYGVLPPFCSFFDVHRNQVYCLITDPADFRIERYDIERVHRK